MPHHSTSPHSTSQLNITSQHSTQYSCTAAPPPTSSPINLINDHAVGAALTQHTLQQLNSKAGQGSRQPRCGTSVAGKQGGEACRPATSNLPNLERYCQLSVYALPSQTALTATACHTSCPQLASTTRPHTTQRHSPFATPVHILHPTRHLPPGTHLHLYGIQHLALQRGPAAIVAGIDLNWAIPAMHRTHMRKGGLAQPCKQAGRQAGGQARLKAGR